MFTCKALPQFPDGSRVRIEKLCDCPKARGRLCALGLTPGTTVEVCSGGPGPCRLKVRGGNVALGHGMASGVYGCRISQDGLEPPCDPCDDSTQDYTS